MIACCAQEIKRKLMGLEGREKRIREDELELDRECYEII